MFENHSNRKKYFEEQELNTKKYIIPFLSNHLALNFETSILEVGCGEGGNLKPFIELGCKTTGIDLTESKIRNANVFFSNEINNGSVRFILGNIYHYSEAFTASFDLVILKDTLEHIPEQEKLIGLLKGFLKPGGKIFLAFPPWEMPFGGHQQMCKNKYLSLFPWVHLLPEFLYVRLLRIFGESQRTIDELLEVKGTRISIGKFEKILKTHNFKIDMVQFYFINPNYEIKFGLKPRKLWFWLSRIPFFRNFITTTCYYLVSVKEN